ncbi:MAG: hypothetical protein WC620_10655 [Methanoregula sp.]
MTIIDKFTTQAQGKYIVLVINCNKEIQSTLESHYLRRFMPIPQVQSDFLPLGIFDCNLQELNLSSFCSNDRRRELTQKLESYMTKLREVGMSGWVILDGSFVTSRELPGDIGILLVINENQQYSIAAPVTQIDHTLLKTEYVKKYFELHLFVSFTDTHPTSGFDDTANEWIEFFKCVKNNPNIQKGLLKVKI